MGLSLKTNLADAERQLDQLGEAISRAKPRALNRLQSQAQTAGLKRVNEIYQIGPRTMEKYISVKFASPSVLEAVTQARGRGFALKEFHPVQTPQGVSVLLKGKRVLFPRAFVVDRFGQNIFSRGHYAAGGFVHTTSRLPIQKLWTFAPSDAFANPEVVAAMDDRVEEQAAKVLQQELSFASKE
jgi:hypothetical protein